MLLSLARAATEEWDESIQHIVQIDASALRIERASFWRVSEETSSVHCDAAYVSSGDYAERGATIVTKDLADYFTELRDTGLLNLKDVAEDARASAWREYWAAREVQSVLHVPVWVESSLVGVLCHEHIGSKHRFRRDQEEFAMGVAHLVAFALGARAHSRAERGAQRAVFLDNVSRMLFQARDVRAVAHRAVDLVASRIADAAFVFAKNRDGVLECLASTHTDPARRGLIDDVVQEMSREPAHARLLSQIVPNQAVLLREFSDDVAERVGLVQLNDFLRKAGLHTAIGVALGMGDAAFGALIVCAAGDPYDSDDLALVSQIGERLAAALENARLHEVSSEAIRARDELLSLTAHELRTPMTALELATQTTLRRATSAGDVSQPNGADTIARHVRRMSTVVEHILDALRIRAEGVVLSPKPCDLAHIVRSAAIAASERSRSSTPIEVRAEPVTGIWDGGCLEHMVRELLDNAMKFGDGMPVEVAVERDGEQAVLTVRNHGIEIPADCLASIFSPFERAVPTEHYGGLGLGLFIAKAIAQAHGGSIGVTSHLPDGTTFVVRLPIDPQTPRART